MENDDGELLAYSEKQLVIINKYNGDAGVDLIRGQNTPVLRTDLKTSHSLSEGYRLLEDLRSNFKDAIDVYRGSADGYTMLVDGLGDVTAAGREFCAKNNIDVTPDSLRKVARVPVVCFPYGVS